MSDGTAGMNADSSCSLQVIAPTLKTPRFAKEPSMTPKAAHAYADFSKFYRARSAITHMPEFVVSRYQIPGFNAELSRSRDTGHTNKANFYVSHLRLQWLHSTASRRRQRRLAMLRGELRTIRSFLKSSFVNIVQWDGPESYT